MPWLELHLRLESADHAAVEQALDEVGALLSPNSSAGILVYENTWAAPFAGAMIRSGGQLVASGRIPVTDLIAAIEASEA